MPFIPLEETSAEDVKPKKGFTPLEVQPPEVKKLKRNEVGIIPNQDMTPAEILNPLGIVEQPAAMLGGAVKAVTDRVLAVERGLRAKAKGGNFFESYANELTAFETGEVVKGFEQRPKPDIDKMSNLEYAGELGQAAEYWLAKGASSIQELTNPQTMSGKLIFNTIGDAFTKGIEALKESMGERGVQLPGLIPFVNTQILPPGKGAEGAADLAANILLFTAPLGFRKTVTEKAAADPLGTLAKDFPETYQRLRAKQQVDIRVGGTEGVQRSAVDVIGDQLINMGVPEHKVVGQPLRPLVKQLIETADVNGEIPLGTKEALVGGYERMITNLADIEAKIAPEKVIRDPNPVYRPVPELPYGRTGPAYMDIASEINKPVKDTASGPTQNSVSGFSPLGGGNTGNNAAAAAPAKGSGKVSGKGMAGKSGKETETKAQREALTAQLFDEGQIAADVVVAKTKKTGKKQKGMVNIQMTPQAQQRIKQAFNPATQAALAGQANAKMDKAIAATVKANKSTTNLVRRNLRDSFVDYAGSMKEDLLAIGTKPVDIGKGFNPLTTGELAVRDYVRSKHATAAAKKIWDDGPAQIFKDLSPEDLVELQKFYTAARVRDLATKNPQAKHVLNPAEATAYILDTEKRLGPVKFQTLLDKTERMFAEYNKLLDMRYKAGLITKNTYERLMRHDYTPAEYVEFLDPAEKYHLRNQDKIVRDSGIDLSEGGINLVRMNPRDVLAEHVVRTVNRIFKNEANISLWRLASENPNPLVKFAGQSSTYRWNDAGKLLTKIPNEKGFTKINVRIQGKEYPLYMDQTLAEPWVTNPRIMESTFGDVTRLISGNTVVKPLVVGANPWFVLSNFPLDIQKLLFFSDQYSNTPYAVLQLGSDLLATAKDAFTKGKRYQDYIAEGGAPTFLARQGWDLGQHIGGKQNFFGERHPSWERVKNAVSYLGEVTEAWNRLALRERALKNGADPKTASYIASLMPDYAQYGTIGKGLDSFLLYFNAGTQNLRLATNAIVDRPAATAARLSWLAGTLGAVQLANMMVNPEAWKDVNTRDKINNLVITTPLKVIGDDGAIRHGYIKVKLDPVLATLNAMVLGTLEHAMFGKVPDQYTQQVVEAGWNTIPLNGPPIPGAWWQYQTNYDTFFNEPIYKGTPLPEVARGYEYSKNTPQAWRDWGQLTGMSPDRSRAALRAVGGNNFYLEMMGLGYHTMVEGMSPQEQAQTTTQLLVNSPGIRRVFNFTHPANSSMGGIDEALGSVLIKQKVQKDQIDQLVDNKVSMGEVRAWVKTQPADAQERLIKSYVTKKALNQIFTKELTAADDVPPKVWWQQTTFLPSEARAMVFHQLSISEGMSRKRMMNIAAKLNAMGTGYMDKQFLMTLHREEQLLGTESR